MILLRKSTDAAKKAGSRRGLEPVRECRRVRLEVTEMLEIGLSMAFHRDLLIASGMRVEVPAASGDFHKCFHIASVTTFMSLCPKLWQTAVVGAMVDRRHLR